MKLLSALYAAIEMIGLLDKWAERSLTSYRKFKAEQRRIEIETAITKAHREGDIETLKKIKNETDE